MPTWTPWRALSVVLILLWGHPRPALACPHPCACYVPSEVHCTFRSLASVPAGISKHVERINLGFNSIQALSETSFAGLTKLELLMMHGNDIPRIPDGALKDLSSLQVFKFSYNKVRVITGQTLQGLWSLVRLHVDHNKIEFIHPQAFNGLTALRLLHLEGNMLHQLHPSTFSTFTFLDYFRLSTLRHLYLAENMIRTLPTGMLQNMPLLENLYLHGNPWSCDCDMAWFLEWDAKSKGILKCKKDKAYEGGQLCAVCSSPRKLYKQEIHKLRSITCLKPSVESPLRQNSSGGSEGDWEREEDDDSLLSVQGFQAAPWNISLNMTDEHGNTVDLVCTIKKPRDVYKIHLNQTDTLQIDINATIALDLDCPMTRESYEKLWKLIAYYSEVPVRLRREHVVGKDPHVSYQYRQDPDEDALYYTGVRARVVAQPAWVMQPSIDIQLNRRQSTPKKVLLSYFSQYCLSMPTKDAQRSRSRSWVMIEPGEAVQRAQAVLEGSPCQLSCNVKASESPSIFWVLPGGSVLKAPMEDQEGKFSIPTSGWLRIKSTVQADSGLYQCIAQVRDETDRMAYRVLVQPPATQPPERHTATIRKNPGDSVMLPCEALAIPEAQLSWILPNNRIINDLANLSHVYMLANGTLSIPKVQVSDSGYYRCVAVNQQGADHFTVEVTVSKKGSGRSSKRGRHSGGKTLSRAREDVVEDEGGSGIGGEEPSRTLLHPKDQEVSVQTKGDVIVKKTKTGRRKLKPWKGSEKEPETNIAEGRRVFESRRRINMANKQINPERWADILARVRGKNVPKATEVPQVIQTTTPASGSLQRGPLPPADPPPSVSPAHTTTGADESSAEAEVSLFGEDDHVSSAVSTTRLDPARGPSGVMPAEPKRLNTHREEFTEDEFSEKTEDATLTDTDSTWAKDTARTSVPYEYSTAWTLDTVYKEPVNEHTAPKGWSTVDAGSMAEPTSDGYESPLDAISSPASEAVPYSYPDVQTHSRGKEDKMQEVTSTPLPPTSTLWVSDSRTSEPHGDPAFRDAEIPAKANAQGHIDRTQLANGGLSSQGNLLTQEDTEENSQVLREGDMLATDPTEPRHPKSQGRDPESATLLDSAPGVVNSVTLIQRLWESTPSAFLDKDTTTVAMITATQKAASASGPTTPPPRKRPNGRKRLRTHRFRHRHKQARPTTFAPSDTFSTPLTHVPEAQTPHQGEGSLVPASWVDSTVGFPKQLERDKQAELVTNGTPRRKHRKRPNKHRPTTSPVSSTASASKPSFDEQESEIPPGSETVRLSTPIPLRTGDPRETSRVGDDMTTTANKHLSPYEPQETMPVTHKPESDEKEIKKYDMTNINDYKSDASDPGDSDTNVASTSGSEVSTVGKFKDESASSGFPGTPSWNLSKAAPSGKWQTDTAGTTSLRTLTDSPFLWSESPNLDFPSEFSPVVPSTLFQQEENVASTTVLSVKVDSSSSQVETTRRGQERDAITPGSPGPQIHVHIPASAEGPGTEFPPTAPVSLAQTTTPPISLPSRASSTWAYSKENVFFKNVGTSETKTPLGTHEWTQHVLRPNGLSTPSSGQGKFNFTPKQELGGEALDVRTKNSLPREPESHSPQDGRAHVFHPPGTVPARPNPATETVRPPASMATQLSVRHFVTSQPPPPLTTKPPVTAYPSRVLPENKPFMSPRLPSTTPVSPRHWSKPSVSTKFPEQRTAQLNSNSKAFGNNNIPDLRDPAGKPPSSLVPHYPNGRSPFFFNRTLSFPHLGVTPKPQIPTSPALGMRERNLHPGPYSRTHSQSMMYVDFGPPAPPLLQPPRTAAPPSRNVHNMSVVHSTQSSLAFMPSVQPSRSFPQSSSKLFSAGGPPASKFWTLGEKPQIITKLPPTVSVIAETDAVFPCEAVGKPKPFITWTKLSTGALMTPNTRAERFEVLKNGTFVIRNVHVQDHGRYMCVAKNLHGLDRMVVSLSVTVRQPQILASHYQDVTVYLGDTILMECLAQGTPAPQISWIFPDRRVWQTVSTMEGRITLHENRTLSIKEASFSDRGVYKCVASNTAGADSLAIRLHVAALPPVIHQEKVENISLPPGLSIHIHCTAKAAPLPSVRWVTADGTQIRPSQFINGNLFVFPNGTLYIRNLAPRDSGRYECVATNMVGSSRRTVQLTVRRAAANARITGTSPQRTDVRYGATLRLDCSASGDPWPRILWRLPSKQMMGALFSFDTRIKVFANGTLVVKSVTDKDAGDYLCVARNKVGDDSVVLKVNVVMKPAKIEHKEENDHRVFYGGDLKVDCVATGLPNPEISWSLPDGSLVNSFMQSDDGGGRAQRFVVFNNGTLYFNEVGMREEGDYTCFAENQVGKDEMRVHVKVVTEPAAIRNKTYSVVQVPYGNVVTVACEAKGELTPRVTWFSPTNRLIPTFSEKYQIYQDGTLLIQKAQRSDSGNYTCVVKNSAGEDRKTVWIHVHVQPPRINGNPDAITTVREIAAGGSRKLIDCQAEGIPTPRVLWAFPEGVVLPAPYYGNRIVIHRNGTLDIRALRKSDSVQLECIGRNEGGEARLIVQLTVLDPVEKPVFHDPVSEKITAMAGHTISLNCSAAGTPMPSLLWVLPNGTELQSGHQLQRFYHKAGGTLHISGLSSIDAGAYRCVARNAAGYTERLVSLKVGLKPEIHNQYHNLVTIINGETLQLHCIPPAGQARVSWTLPNGLILGSPHTHERFSLWENGTLTVRDASVFDRGTYVCKVDTKHGPSIVNFPVIVIAYPPRITSEPTPVMYTRLGTTVKISCMAMAIPKAEITWELPDKSHLTAGAQARLYGNRFLHPQGSLTIQQATQRDAGFYKCTAKNIVGADSKTTYIHVY